MNARPRRSLRDVVFEFMRLRVHGSTHPALDTRQEVEAIVQKRFGELGVSINSNVTNIRNVPLTESQLESLYSGCVEAQKRLQETIEKSSLKEKLGFDTTANHSWREVENLLDAASDALEDAKEEYVVGKTEGRFGRIREGFRKFGINAKNAKFFIALIPSQDHYLSSLTGGLKLVCAAAERIGAVRQTILDALEDIPCILNEKCRLMDMLDKTYMTEELHRSNSALSVAVLQAVEAMIQWFEVAPAKKIGKGLLKPATYEQTVTEKIELIRKKSERFKTQADISFKCVTLRNEEQFKGLFSLLSAEGLQRGKFMERRFDYIEDNQAEQSAKIAEQSAKIDALTQVSVMLLSEVQGYKKQAGRETDAKTPARIRKIQNVPKVEDLLRMYHFDPHLIAEDCENLLNLRNSMDEDDQDRAVSLLQDPDFNDWLRSPDSSALLVHGNGTHSPQSPTSFVSAKLFETLYTKPELWNWTTEMALLAFFCGEHADEAFGLDSTPFGLTLSLVLQLIDLENNRRHEINPSLLSELMDHLTDITTTLDLFAQLVMEISQDAVLFIILDAISFYEDSARSTDLAMVIVRINELVQQRKGPTIKLLVTSPAATDFVWKAFDGPPKKEGKRIIQMKRRCSSQGGFRALGWEGLMEY